MQHHDAESDKRDIGLPKVYELATTTERNDQERRMNGPEFINEQVNSSYSLQSSSTVLFPKETHSYDRKGFLKQIAPIDGAEQKIFPTSLAAQLLYQWHYWTLPGHTDERRMYNRMGREYYWPYMEKEVYTTVWD